MRKFHKKIRLDADVYKKEGYVCLITLCTEGRIPAFRNSELSMSCIERLKADAGLWKVPVFAYCFMPDHLHLVVSPGTKDLVRFMGEYKGKTTRMAWQSGIKGRFWQKSFYDHFLRKEEALIDTVMYVLNNPVRGGLVSEWRMYPYAGSFVYDLEHIVT